MYVRGALRAQRYLDADGDVERGEYTTQTNSSQ